LLDLSLTEFSRIENLEADPLVLKDLVISDTSSGGKTITTLSNPTEEVAVNLVGFTKAEVEAAIDTVSEYSYNDFDLVIEELFVIRIEEQDNFLISSDIV